MVESDTEIVWRKVHLSSPSKKNGPLGLPHVYLRPLGILWGELAKKAVADGLAWPFLGDGAYTSCQIMLRLNQSCQISYMTARDFGLWRSRQGGPLLDEIEDLFDNLSVSRVNRFGHTRRMPAIVGILNLTPDSFSDGGEYVQLRPAVTRALQMIEDGAALIDLGGESTRPGAKPISSQLEQKRVLPVLEALIKEGIPLSIDTYHADTMQAASALGVAMLNDVTGFSAYPESTKIAAASGKVLVLVHSSPTVSAPSDGFEGEVAIEVFDVLYEKVKMMEELGVSKTNIIVDPGLGFGKSENSNLKLLRWLSLFHGLGCEIMLGASRKFGRLEKGASLKDRLGGSIATSIYGAQQGVQLLRVHDVTETRQALGVLRAIE